MARIGSFQIALATRDQFEQLQKVELAAATLFSDEDVPEQIRLTATTLGDFSSAHANEMLWVALSPEEKPVGFAMVRMVDKLAHLQEIDVHPGHARQGAGTSLIDTVCTWSRSQGIPAVTLTTFRHLPWNAPFYERLGFRLLKQGELTSGLAAVLAYEAASGLDPTKRVAMLKLLR